MTGTRKDVRAERARANYARMMEAGGSIGWSRQRRHRALTGAGLLIGGGALVASVLGLLDRDLTRAIRYGVLSLLLLSLAWPLKRKLWPVERVLHDGAPALAVPMRAVPLRLAAVLTVVGLLIGAGGVFTGVRKLMDGNVVGVVPLLFGLVMGLAVAGLGLVNLAGPARRPKPLLINAQGITWWLARLPQLVRWTDITEIEEWSRPIGLAMLNPRSNCIRIRAREGVTPGWVDNRLVAAEPAAVRDLLRHYLENPADRGTLSRTS